MTERHYTVLRDRDVVVEYSVLSWGTPETGRWGPPELYDCGSPPEFEIESVIVEGGGEIRVTDDEIDILLEEIRNSPPERDDPYDR
jgi:hypothetical protein